MQKMTDPPLAEDPETGVPLQRVFHPIAVHFKGKGFYNTDYGTKKRAREKADHEGAKKKSEKSDAAKSESSGGDSSSGGESKKSDTVSKAEPAPKKPAASPKSD
jgi:predicted nucleic acid-binding Zn ribbon protein